MFGHPLTEDAVQRICILIEFLKSRKCILCPGDGNAEYILVKCQTWTSYNENLQVTNKHRFPLLGTKSYRMFIHVCAYTIVEICFLVCGHIHLTCISVINP